jgi:hypothetical protein
LTKRLSKMRASSIYGRQEYLIHDDGSSAGR